MPPGEPVGSSAQGERDFISKWLHQTLKASDWYVKPIVNFDGDKSDMDEVYKAVKFWRDLALELKSKNYPLAEGIDNYQSFDEETRKKAHMLDDFLDGFIDEELQEDEKTFEILRVLIAQGEPYMEFKQKMKENDFSLKCNEIWENDAVAFRCNTCALTPCMSLCEDCFESNGHAGHDYTRFFSREGGACDCGNQDVIKEQGNCKNHGDESKRPNYDMSEVCLAEYIVMKLIVRLFLEYRGWASRYEKALDEFKSESNEPINRRAVFDIGEFTVDDAARSDYLITFLQECVKYGGPMRLIVSKILLDKNLYKVLTEQTTSNRVQISLDWRTAHMFKDDRRTVLPPDNSNFSFVGSIESTECTSLLDELIFWINRQLFPQNLVNFGLSLLSEPGYRDAFAYRFFSWYPISGKVISDLCISQAGHSRAQDLVTPACSRAVHVTVQMLSSASLCKELNENVHLVKTIFDVTRFLICEKSVDSEISLKSVNIFKESSRFLNMTTTNGRPKWRVMTMANNAAISQHGYWFVMGDIQNVLTHTSQAIAAVFDDECFGGSYMKMMCEMQGMNPIWRIISGNAQENDAGEGAQRAYTLEFETLAVTLFNIVAAIQQEKDVRTACRFFDHIRSQLEEWFHVLLPVTPEDRSEVWGNVIRAQAHISTAITHFTELDGFYDHIRSNLLNDETLIRLLLVHPLRIQVARAEINCNMWVRNGAQAKMSALIYSQWNVSSAFQTPDVDLIRFCAAHIDKEHFMKALTASFNITECIKIQRGRFVEKSEESKILFQGVGGRDDDEVSEARKTEFERYQRLVREQALLMEDMMLTPEKNLFQFDEKETDEAVDVMIEANNATEVTIDFTIQSPIDHSRDPRIPIVGEFIRRHLEAAGVDADIDVEMEREFDPRLFDDEEVERTIVIREPEWIDPMFWGMFKLVAELVVVRVNSGASPEEHYRSEMVNCMAMGNVPYSRLRASISEKGSRGSEMIDKHFETILNEIGDFIEPIETTTHLMQGSYQLKTSIWDSEVCPVFFMMRSTSIKQAREVFAKMEIREQKNALDKDLEVAKIEERFWVPFRLIDFSDQKRHRGISNLYNVLLTERFLIHCITVLASEADETAKFHDGTYQLAVYLLTLGVKYAQSYVGDEKIKKQMIDIFHTPFQLIKFREMETFLTVCAFMIRLLTKETRKNGALVVVFKGILSGEYDKEKVTGGKMIYLARFVTILTKLSPVARQIIEGKLKREELRISKHSRNQEKMKAPMDPVKKAAKEAAKRRMEAIMQNSAKKSAQTMEKLMKTEGMTDAEVNKVDPSQQNRKVYECPICGEQNAPNTVENPFGMLAKLSTNFICEEQIDASINTIDDLLKFDEYEHVSANRLQSETRRRFFSKRRQATFENQDIVKVNPPLVGTDLKTCGHAAHIACFNAYRASLYDGHQRSTDRREVGCPMCRYTVNVIVPMSFDKPYTPIKTPASPMSYSDVWRVMDVVLKKAKGPVFQEDERNVKYSTNYSTREGGGLFELYIGRIHSADLAERKSSQQRCTVSTLMVSLAVVMVERSSIMRKMGVPERRKNQRNSMTEHLMTASVATSKDVDFDVALSALTNLFAKVTENSFSRPPSEQPSTSKEPAQGTEAPNPEAVVGLSSDEMAAMITKPLRKDTPDCLSKLPLFALDPKATLVRMLAVLIDNQSLTKDIQREIAQNMIFASLGWVSSYTLLCLILRTGEEKISALNKGEPKIQGLSDHLQSEAEAICQALTYNTEYFKHLAQRLESPDVEPTDEYICKTMNSCLIEFLRFSYELLFHCNLGFNDVNNQIHSRNIDLDNVLRLVGISELIRVLSF
eukprot:NP_001293508.1 Uncharacterized protein CELE_F10G7.10 [Caenorhabditis elegans]